MEVNLGLDPGHSGSRVGRATSMSFFMGLCPTADVNVYLMGIPEKSSLMSGLLCVTSVYVVQDSST